METQWLGISRENVASMLLELPSLKRYYFEKISIFRFFSLLTLQGIPLRQIFNPGNAL